MKPLASAYFSIHLLVTFDNTCRPSKNAGFVPAYVNEFGGESYVDASWRMRKIDVNGNINPIPLHFYIHDSQNVPGGYLQPNHIRIMIRNASGSNPWQELRFHNDTSFQSYFSNESCIRSTTSRR